MGAAAGVQLIMVDCQCQGYNLQTLIDAGWYCWWLVRLCTMSTAVGACSADIIDNCRYGWSKCKPDEWWDDEIGSMNWDELDQVVISVIVVVIWLKGLHNECTVWNITVWSSNMPSVGIGSSSNMEWIAWHCLKHWFWHCFKQLSLETELQVVSHRN